MKNLRYIFSLLSLIAFAACDNGDEQIIDPEAPLPKVSFNISAEVPDSRTALLQDDNGNYRAYWKDGDPIFALEIADSTPSIASGNISGDALSTSFTVTFSGKSASEYIYMFACPNININSTATYLYLKLPTEQSPAAMTTFDGAADILLSNAVVRTTQPSGETIPFEVSRLSSIGKVTVKNLALAEGDKVKSVTFSASKPLTGELTNIMVADIVAEKDPLTNSAFAVAHNSVKVTLPEAQSGDFTYFMSCWPTTLSAGEQYTVTVQTEQDTFTKTATLPSNLAFLQGEMTSFTVNMAGIAPGGSGSGDSNAIPNNEIHYTSTDGKVVTPYKTDVFGANIVSNTYSNGHGVITFDGAVTSIGGWAFCDCSGLTSVTIPNSVTSIGMDAFCGCSSLTSVTIGNSVTSIGDSAFASCSSLTSVTIPDSVTSIGDGAFAYCSSLTSVIIPDSVTSIGKSAFAYCSSLTSITIPDSVTSIGSYTFNYCSSLTSVTIGNSVTSIGMDAFYGCSSLTSVTIPNSVTSIGERAFANCGSLQAFYGKFASSDNRCLVIDGVLKSFAPSGLTSYTIPDSITSIGEWAFYNCSSLTSVTIPDNVTSIGNCAFQNCSSLQAFYGKYASSDNRCLVIDGVLNSFAPSGLTSYTIPESVTSIGYAAFAHCSSLTSVTIGNSVTSIGYCAFAYCSSLTSVTIPDSVTSIENYAFYDCYSLTSVYCKPTTPPTLSDSYVFDYNATGRKIYVPAASVDAYKSANYWSSYADAIVAEGGSSNENSKIYYTTTDGNIVKLNNSGAFWVNIVSNTYENGQGVITFDGQVTTIGDNAFRNCETLKTIEIPEGVEEIGYQAFEVCSSLESITIPTTLKSFGSVAFNACEQLKSVHISDLTAWCKITPTSGDCNPLSYGADLYLNGSKVTNLTIPSEITTINNMAFYGCGSLMSVTIPSHVTNISWSAFCGCQNIAQLTIEEGVTTIESYAFANCSKLKSVTIPDSVWRLGEAVFSRCNSLTEINCRYSTADKRCLLWNSTLNSFAPADLTSYDIPDSVTAIGSEAFYGYSNLTSISIPEGVTSIGHSAFFNCDALTNVTLPQSVTYIYMAAFNSCNKLESVTIGANVGTIEDYAFNSCNKLTTVYCNATTPPTLGGTSVFDGNASGRKIYVPSSVVSAYKSAQYWSEYADAIVAEEGSSDENRKIYYTSTDGKVVTPYATNVFGANIVSNTYENGQGVITFDAAVTSIGNIAFYGCSTLTSVTIGNSVTSIGYEAFRSCSSLTSVTIPDSVTSIGSGAFANCTGLTSVTIPDSVTSIGGSAFNDCVSLTSVTIGNSVTSIGGYAFYSCNSLTSVYCKPATPPTLGGSSVFDYNATDRKIYVPSSAVSAYKSAQYWSEYADAIEADGGDTTIAGFEMVFVKGGTFNMGSTDSYADDDENPIHSVMVSDFYIGKFEVTQGQWRAIMGNNPSTFTGDDNRPVECVSWNEVQEFINKLNTKTGNNFRLPTEAEWEYAARGGNKSKGYEYSGSNTIDDVAWYSSNSNKSTHPVGQKQPNELGIYDMSGNVYEWCQDWWDFYSSNSQIDPIGPSSGYDRILRGSCWSYDARSCRVSARFAAGVDNRESLYGLRLVCLPE